MRTITYPKTPNGSAVIIDGYGISQTLHMCNGHAFSVTVSHDAPNVPPTQCRAFSPQCPSPHRGSVAESALIQGF